MKLAVWWGRDRVVGTLWQAEGALLFRYRADCGPSDRISASLPVDPSRDQPGAFFSNLLPEGSLRERLAHQLGVSVENDFAMLTAVGGDCAGALALLPEGETASAKPSRKALTPEALRRARELGSETVLAAEKLRLSLAAAQDKVPVIEDGGKLFLPSGPPPRRTSSSCPRPASGVSGLRPRRHAPRLRPPHLGRGPDANVAAGLFSVLERRAQRTLAAGYPGLTFLPAADDGVAATLHRMLAESPGRYRFEIAEGRTPSPDMLH